MEFTLHWVDLNLWLEKNLCPHLRLAIETMEAIAVLPKFWAFSRV